jgi:hypothetical protein
MPHSRQRPLIVHEIEKKERKLKLLSKMKTHRGIAKHKLPSQTKQVKSESRDPPIKRTKPLDNSTRKGQTPPYPAPTPN